MIIANFDEYIKTLRELFAQGREAEMSAYAQDIQTSGVKQKEVKEKLQRKISLIVAKINQLRQEIAQTTDKATISTQIKHLKKARQDLVSKLKKRDKTSRFSVLSSESKAALCTLTVLRKYMTKEILENEFLRQQKDKDGNIVFNRNWFESASLLDDAVHIYDYISAYVQQHPERVTSESYFNKLFDKEKGWRGICHQADKFFENLNKEKRKKSRIEIIAESRSDLELIKQYPDDGIIFVRLKSPDALDYEGAAAHHCVGGGSYDKLINEQNSGIYSLRRLTQDGELKPAVTIELNKGIIKQVRGVCNSFIAYKYSLPSRDAIMLLLDKKTSQELADDKNVPNQVLNAVGLYRDGKGGFLDIHNLSGTEDFELPDLYIMADGLKDYEWEKLKISSVTIQGELTEEYAAEIERLEQAKQITIENASGNLKFNLDGFSRLQKLTMQSKDGAKVILEGSNSTLESISTPDIELIANKNLYLSAVKSIELLSAQNAELNVSSYPNIERLVINIQNKTPLRLTGTAPYLRKMSVCATKWPNIDIKVPKLEELELTLNNQTEEINLSEFTNLKKLHLGGKTSIYKTRDFNSLEKLELLGCYLDNMDMRRFSNLKELYARDLDLTDCGFIPKNGIKYRYSNCVVDQDIFLKMIDENGSFEFSSVNMKGKHLDFSSVTETLDIYNISFTEAESIKFAPKVKKLNWNGDIPPMTKITGLEQIEDLDVSIHVSGDKKTSNASLLINLDPLSVQRLKYESLFQTNNLDISKFTNIKAFSGSLENTALLASDIEDLNLYIGFGGILAFDELPPESDNKIIDLRWCTKLKRLSMEGFLSTQERIMFPDSLEELNIKDVFKNLTEIDLRNCSKLKKIKFKLVAPELQQVYLPDSLQEISAKYCESGIGIDSAGFEKAKLKFEIPNTAKPEIISYLRKEWGDEKVSVIPQKKEAVNSYLLLQKGNKLIK